MESENSERKETKKRRKRVAEGEMQRDHQVIWPKDVIYDTDLRCGDKCAPKLDERRNGL